MSHEGSFEACSNVGFVVLARPEILAESLFIAEGFDSTSTTAATDSFSFFDRPSTLRKKLSLCWFSIAAAGCGEISTLMVGGKRARRGDGLFVTCPVVSTHPQPRSFSS